MSLTPLRRDCGLGLTLASRICAVGVCAQSSTIDFALCLGATASEKLAARTKIKVTQGSGLEKKDEIVANVIWRFLELRGYVDSLLSL